VVAELTGRRDEFASILVHTGQLGEPDFMLGVGSGTQAEQTARVMERLEKLLIELRPDLVLVPGGRELDARSKPRGGKAPNPHWP
jgi:UDP-N-acetylglucosamine 2-epimerase